MPKRKILDWPTTILEYHNSNSTVEEFCTELGIHPNTFYKNRKKYQGTETRLVKLPLKQSPVQPQSLLIQYGDFVLKIPKGVDSGTLETTLRALRDIR